MFLGRDDDHAGARRFDLRELLAQPGRNTVGAALESKAHLGIGEAASQASRRVLGHDAAVVQEDDLVADAGHLVHLVAGVDDRQVSFFAELFDERQGAVGDVGVERGGWLVHQHDLGVVQQRLDQVDARLLAGRECPKDLAHVVGDAEVLAQVADLFFRPRDPVEPGKDDQVLPDADAALEHAVRRREVDALQAGFAVLVQVQAEVADTAAVGQGDADQHLDGGGLAGAIGPEQADDAALLQGEADVVDGAERAVELGQVVDFQDGRHGRR